MADKSKPKWDVEPTVDGKYWVTQDGKRIKSFDRLTDAENHIKVNKDKPPQKLQSQQEQLDELEKKLKDKSF